MTYDTLEHIHERVRDILWAMERGSMSNKEMLKQLTPVREIIEEIVQQSNEEKVS